MIKAVFFDLDGTLLPMNENVFTKYYFGLLCKKMEKYGLESEMLQKSIWGGVKAMYSNDGSVTNEEKFFEFFQEIYGSKIMDLKPVFYDFYSNEFKQAKTATFENPYAREIVDFVNENFEYNILSTNPIFPYNGTMTRMGFVGLKEEDFDFITTYENSYFTKPNPKYFLDILEKFNLKPEEVVLFGNNTLEDYMCASSIGIKCFLVGDFIIHNDGEPTDIKYIKLCDIVKELKTLKEA